MSSEAFASVPQWMIRESTLSGNALLVYMALASHSGKGGIFMKQETLCREARLSAKPVRAALAELEAEAVVQRVERRNAHGHRKATGYRLAPNGDLLMGESLAADSPTRKSLPADSPSPTGSSSQLVPYIEEEPLKKNPSIVSPDIEAQFAVAYSHWPKKKERKASLDKFKVKVRSSFGGDAAPLVELIAKFGDAYAATTETQFVPALVHWLNRERWTDELPQAYSRPSALDIGRALDEELRAEAAQHDWSQGEIGAGHGRA